MSLPLQLIESRNYSGAIPLLEADAKRSLDAFGERSAEYAQSLFILTLTRFQADPEESTILANFDKILKIRISVFGEIHPSVAITADLLATALTRVGRLDEAEAVIRLGLNNAIKLVGPNHINTAKSKHNLAQNLFQRREKIEEAHEFTEDALRIRREIFGSSSAETAETLVLYSQILSVRGLENESSAVLQEAENISEDLSRSSVPSQQCMN
jgi:tetratricopeptide (TPR) repeat protein